MKIDAGLVYVSFLAVTSFVAFILYGIDKQRAKRNERRIPEKALLSVSFFGGGIGGYIAMQVFRHKTKKRYFHCIHIIGIAWQVAVWGIWL